MAEQAPFHIGNAKLDQVRGSGWFVGQFVPPELGLRHQTEVEIKWGVHPDGDRRAVPWAHGHGTTVAILIRGALRLSFHIGTATQQVMLEKEGDYVVYGPDMLHSWTAIGDTLVVTVRFPSVEIGRPAGDSAQDPIC